METNSIDISQLEAKMAAFEEQGKTAMIMAVDGKAAGLIAVADTLKGALRRSRQGAKGNGS